MPHVLFFSEVMHTPDCVGLFVTRDDIETQISE